MFQTSSLPRHHSEGKGVRLRRRSTRRARLRRLPSVTALLSATVLDGRNLHRSIQWAKPGDSVNWSRHRLTPLAGPEVTMREYMLVSPWM